MQVRAPNGDIVEFPDGMSQEQIASAMAAEYGGSKPGPSIPEDVAKSFGSGVARGTSMLAGTGGDINKLMAAGIQKAGEAGVPVDQIRQPYLDAMPSFLRQFHEQPAPQVGSKEIMGAVDRATGLPITSYQPQTTAGKYARTVGEFTPTAVMGGGGIMRGALGAGLGSEFAGQMTEGTKWETPARVLGAMGGSVVPSVARRAVTPLPISPERQAMVDALKKEGVTDITAGQATGRKRLQYFEAERGAGPALADSAGEQFTSAALKRTGTDAKRATPEVIDDAFKRIGSDYDALTARNTLVPDAQMGTDLTKAVQQYEKMVPPNQRAPAVQNWIDDITGELQKNGGALPGDVYQSFRSQLTSEAGKGTDHLAKALKGIRNALDDGMGRSISPADQAAWKEANRQYRNLKSISKASTAAGENAALGLISPAQLRMQAVNQGGHDAYARGRGDLSELARSGVSIMTPLPNSGTAGRSLAQNMGTSLSAVIGALIGGGAGSAAGPVGMSLGGAAGAAAGTMLPTALGHAATSPLGRQYLANQLMTGINAPDPKRVALINALFAGDKEIRKRLQ